MSWKGGDASSIIVPTRSRALAIAITLASSIVIAFKLWFDCYESYEHSAPFVSPIANAYMYDRCVTNIMAALYGLAFFALVCVLLGAFMLPGLLRQTGR